MQYEIEDADVGFEGYVTKVRFPKAQKDYNGWCAFDFQVDSVFIGEIRKNTIKNGIIPLCGYAPLAKENIRYRVYAKYEMSPKYGHTYQVCYMSSIVSLETEEDVKNFLLTILPQKTVENFMEYTKDPIGLIKSGDISEMCNIKGIGFTRAKDIVAKFKGIDDRAEVYSIFTKLGLTKRLADDLIEQYKSADSLMADINKNPYILIEKCDGIGWSKADNLALKMGVAEDSEFRIEAYINYFLTKIAETEGHTWVTLQNLLSSILGLSKVITKDRAKTILRGLVDNGKLHYEEQTKRIGLNKYYRLEKRICDELVRLRDAEVFPVKHIDETIADCEKTVGFEYTQEQKDAIYKIFKNNVFLLTANAGCVDKDTEFFNGEKWKKISEYKSGESVLQYNEDGSASLTKPLMYFKKPCDKLYHFETKYGINQTVCEEHDVLYWKNENTHDSCKVKEIKDKQELYRSGFSGKIKAGFSYSGKGINLTDEEIRVMCAVICDGSFDSSVEFKTNSHSYKYCRFHIKKDRKKERLRKLFLDAKIDFKEHNSAAKGYTDFYIKAPMRTKIFDEFWYNCTNKQLQVICDEILYWDGSITKTKNNKEKRKFSTTIKENADFVQFAFTSCGYRATIKVDDRKGKKYFTSGKQYIRKSVYYEVFISNNVFVGLGSDNRICHKKTKVEEVKSEDGYKYCFMVESTMLVLRRNNCIFITHNCGKTTIMYPVARILRRNGYNFASCALSGKASLNLSETIGEEGKTIHRLLEFNGFTTQFDRDVNNPLEQNVVILDEVSMVGGDLFLHLLRAMKTGTKLIMIGDPGQLESIGLCNLISDIKGSGKIAQAYLTKIFRQAQKSGIITDSLKVYHQEQILPSNGFIGSETHGELKDFEIISKNTTQDCLNEIIKKFKKLYYEDKISIDDIIIAVAKRAVGPLSARCVNQIIQNLLELPKNKTLTHKYSDQVLYEITFHVGDKVLVTKNNYKAETIEGTNYPIFNGNIGTVYDICGDTLLLKIDDKIMLYGPGEIGDLQLGYAVTTHKCVSGDTMIYTSNGYKTIKQFAEENNYNQIGDYEYSGDELVWSGQSWEKPKMFYNIGESDGFYIKCEGNREITVTKDHKFLVKKNNSQKEEWVSAEDLCIGDCIKLSSEVDEINNNYIELDSSFYNYYLDIRAIVYKKPKVLNSELAMLLGMIVADGTIYKNHTGIRYGKKQKEVVEKFIEIVNSLFGYQCKFSYWEWANMYCAEINSVDICKFLLKFGGLESNKKDIPKLIEISSKDVQRSFLKGVFEDGTVHIKKGMFDMIEFCSIDKSVRDKIYYMLIQNGIHSSLFYKKSSNSYHIFIYGSMAKRFADKIGFIGNEKNRRLSLIPNTRINKSYRTDDNYFVKIKEIKSEKFDSYCFKMPKEPQFIQNGFIGSNCQGTGYPYVIAVCDPGSFNLLSKEHLYTEITRAKKYCTLIGTPKAITTAIKTTRVVKKQTYLGEMLAAT